MKTKKTIIFLVMVVTLFLGVVAGTNIIKNLEVEEKKENYPVSGIWHASATWHENNPYNYGGDNYLLENYFNFQEDGTLLFKSTLKYNGQTISKMDWIVLNFTWSVSGNVINFSNGKQFVIVDDQFNDLYTNPQIMLYYKKLN